jgi:hypothetical protein
MAVHKLQIDDFVTVDYELIAIHSSLEDYRLAYFINRSLQILLEKSPKNIGIKTREGESCFTRFFYEDPESDTAWNLIQNRNSIDGWQENESSLFGSKGINIAANIYLVPELKKVDYILKVENTPSFFALEQTVNSLLAVKQITTAYKIDHSKLKSKNNLIF